MKIKLSEINMKKLIEKLDLIPSKKLSNTLKKVVLANIIVTNSKELNEKYNELLSMKEKLAYFKLNMLKKYREKNLNDISQTESSIKKIDKILNNEISLCDDDYPIKILNNDNNEKAERILREITEKMIKVESIKNILEEEIRTYKVDDINPVYKYFT
ncbi:hypothetical protein DMUE_5279 [Dictyocoela muelleri]|nr:hypothetical protein DMUE_5279 [Dictyocoela muelleri]